MLEPEVVEDGDNESNCKVFFNFTVAYHLQFEEEREVEKHGLSTGASPEAPVDNCSLKRKVTLKNTDCPRALRPKRPWTISVFQLHRCIS